MDDITHRIYNKHVENKDNKSMKWEGIYELQHR